jgi:hypothetical protein
MSRTTTDLLRALALSLLVSLPTLGALVLVSEPARSSSGQRVAVHFPAGGCPPSARLEIEVWVRGAQGEGALGGEWKPHPEHPSIAPGSCQQEDPAVLLNEIRVRCVDPAGERSPSAWVVGADVSGKGAGAPCPAPASSPRAP